MITTMYNVKLYRGMFDGTLPTVPDVNDDETQGYYVGFRLLCGLNGIDYICSVATTGAAEWSIDAKNDEEINLNLHSISTLIIKYCNKIFITDEPDYHESVAAIYNGNTVNDLSASFDDLFFPKDSLLILGSRRNDGVYELTNVDGTALTISESFPIDLPDASNQLFLILTWPRGLSQIGARMVEYDTYRRNDSPGLSSEGVGSYSSSKEVTDIMGTAYPDSVVAGIQTYKRPRIADGVGVQFIGYRFNG